MLPLAVPLAVCEAAEELAAGLRGREVESGGLEAKAAARAETGPLKCEVKWPNDIWLEGRKLAGVLIEARPQDGWAVIGIGLNLTISPEEFPPDLRAKADLALRL